MGLLAILKQFVLVTIYFAAVVFLLLSLVGKTKPALMLYILLLPLQNVFVKLYQFPFGNNLSNFFMLALLIGWVVEKASKKDRLFENNPFNYLLIFYIIYTYISLWRGSFYFNFPLPIKFADLRFQDWKNFIFLPVIFLIVFNNIKNKKEIRFIIFIACLSFVVMNRTVISEIFDATTWVSRSKFHGSFVWLGANEVAAFYASYTLVLLGLCLYMKRLLPKFFLFGLIIINFYCLIFMYSRGEYWAAIAGLCIIGISRSKTLLFLLLFLFLLWQSVLPRQVVERLKFTEQEGQLDASAENRIEYWNETLNYFKQSPLIGVGFRVKTELGSGKDTHNLYIRTLAEQGIIGLLLLLSIWGIAFSRAIKLFKRADDKFLKGLGLGFAACVVAVVIGNIFGDRWTYLSLAAYFWIFLALVERGNMIVLEKAKLTKKAR